MEILDFPRRGILIFGPQKSQTCHLRAHFGGSGDRLIGRFIKMHLYPFLEDTPGYPNMPSDFFSSYVALFMAIDGFQPKKRFFFSRLKTGILAVVSPKRAKNGPKRPPFWDIFFSKIGHNSG